MNEPLSAAPDDLVLCERKSFTEAVSIGGVVFGVLTLGLGFLLLYGIYALVPRQIRINDGRVFADKILPADGVPLASARVTIRTVTLATAEVARTADVEFVDQGKRYIVAINRHYYPESQVDRAVDFFAGAKED